MTYDSFKEFLLRYLWRPGDTQLTSDLDTIIAAANSKLTRDLRVPRMTVTSYAFAMTDLEAALPDDFRRPLLVQNSADMVEFKSTSPSNIADLQSQQYVETVPFYAIAGRLMRVAGGPPSVSSPLNLLLDYQAKVPDFQATDSTWLLDEGEYTDLYITAVLSETPFYLRNDARVSMWAQAYQEKLNSVNDDTTTLSWGAPLASAMPSGVK